MHSYKYRILLLIKVEEIFYNLFIGVQLVNIFIMD